VANEALALMRAKAPEVEEWARAQNVVADPSVLAKRLKGTKHWLDAAVMEGVPLAPQEEETLGNMLPSQIEAYANKFHPQGRWAPMEKALLAHLKDTYDGTRKAITYAATRIGGRWPELEPYLLRFAMTNDSHASDALQYATQAVKGRWPELEAKFWKTKSKQVAPSLAASYAIDVLKQPWRDVLPQTSFQWGMARPEALMCLNSPDVAIRYAQHFKFGSWPEFAQVLMANNDLDSYIDYLDKVEGKRRDPRLEARLLAPGEETYRTLVPLDKWERRQWHWRHPEEEMPESRWSDVRVPKDELANKYAFQVLGQRWPGFEERMLREAMDKESSILPKDFKGLDEDSYGGGDLPQPFHGYIEATVKGRWPEFEQALLRRYQDYPDTWKTNQALVTSYINLIAEVTKQTETKEEPTPPYYSHRTGPRKGIWPEGEAVLGQRSPSHEEYLRENVKNGYEKHAQSKAEQERRRGLPEEERKGLPYHSVSDTDLWHAGKQIREYILFLRKHGNDWPDGAALLNEVEDFREKANPEERYLHNRLSSHKLLRPQRLPHW
jgi:hypothetical protein